LDFYRGKIQIIRLRTSFLKTTDIKSHITQHGGREGEQDQVTVCCLEVTVHFSPAIDRQSVSTVIVEGLCDAWSKMKSDTLVTDEQNELSLCPAEGPANLVAVRIRCLSV
jgi:hypothetical protein